MIDFGKERQVCYSRLVFDRLLAGEQQGLSEALEHVAKCQRCREHLDALRAEQAASMGDKQVAAAVDRMVAVASSGRERVALLRGRIMLSAGTALAAAAALLIVLRLGDPVKVPDAPAEPGQAADIRIKGSATFQVLRVGPGSRGETLSRGQRVSQGETLAFAVSSPRKVYVSLAGVGERNEPYIIDHDHSSPWRVESAEPVQLPVSAEVDDQPGSDRIFAAFCQKPVAAEALAEALARLYPKDNSGAREVRAARIPSLEGCTFMTVLLERAVPDGRTPNR